MDKSSFKVDHTTCILESEIPKLGQVDQYLEDISKYLYEKEEKDFKSVDLFKNQTKISGKMRAILID